MAEEYIGIKIVEDSSEVGYDSPSHNVAYYLGGNLVVTGTVSSSGGGEVGPLFTIDNATLNTTAVVTAQSFLFPATGGHIALLDLAQTWSAAQTFTASDFLLKGSSSGATTLNSGLTGGSSNILTLPITASDTLAALATAQTWTAAQTFTASDFLLKGSSTGKTTLNSGLTGGSSNTLTLPITSSDTLAALGTAQSWSALQTFGNNISIGGHAFNIAAPTAGQALVYTAGGAGTWVNSAYSATLTTGGANTWAALQSFPGADIQFLDANDTQTTAVSWAGVKGPFSVGTPFTWLEVTEPGGTIVYIPCFQ